MVNINIDYNFDLLSFDRIFVEIGIELSSHLMANSWNTLCLWVKISYFDKCSINIRITSHITIFLRVNNLIFV